MAKFMIASLRPSSGRDAKSGFSLVELLVAMVFTAILMAGMAKVFQASLGTFYTAGEKLSSARRNRLSLDILYDDLNVAGMLLIPSDISAQGPQSQAVSTTNPLFQIVPNTSVTIPKANADGTDLIFKADQLLLYADQALPFEGSLDNALAGTQSLMGTAGGVGTMPSSTSYSVTFDSAPHANLVKTGMMVVFLDNLSAQTIGSASPTGATVTITPSTVTSVSAGAPTGSSAIDTNGHLAKARVLIVQPAQQVRYSIQPQFLDPSNAAKAIPCLMREQENYIPGGFVSYLASGTPTADYSSTIVAENVTGLKFYLSLNPGDTTSTPNKVWAGYQYTGTDFNGGILGIGGSAAGTVNGQLATYGLPLTGYQSITPTNFTWFRDIPVAVRADVTTRTANPRTEYNQTTATPQLVYNTRQETLVLVPRHFGLTLR